MEIYLVRHGQTELNAKSVFFGITDIALNAKGETQAQLVAEKLRRIKFDTAFVSPLKRAQQTVKKIQESNIYSLSIQTLPELCEVDFGDWENMTLADISKAYSENLNSYFNNFLDHTFLSGQSIADFLANIRRAMEVILNSPNERVLIVSHYGVIGGILNMLLFGEIKDLFNFEVPTGGMAIIEKSDDYYMLKYLG